nr:MAG: hypothetical protein [Microvirus sp.]
MTKVYQLVSAADGTRSPLLTMDSLKDMAAKYKDLATASPESDEDPYVLIILEELNGEVHPSRAPLMRLSYLISVYGEKA